MNIFRIVKKHKKSITFFSLIILFISIALVIPSKKEKVGLENHSIPPRDRLYKLVCTNNTYSTQPPDWVFNTNDKCSLTVQGLHDTSTMPVNIKTFFIRSDDKQPITDDNYFSLLGTTEHFAILQRSVYKSKDKQKYWQIFSVNIRTSQETIISEDLIDSKERSSLSYIDYASEKIIFKNTANKKGPVSAGSTLAQNAWGEELYEYDLSSKTKRTILTNTPSSTQYVVYRKSSDQYLLSELKTVGFETIINGLYLCDTNNLPCKLEKHPLSEEVTKDNTRLPLISSDKSTLVWLSKSEDKTYLRYTNLNDINQNITKIDITPYKISNAMYLSPRGGLVIGQQSPDDGSKWFSWTLNQAIAKDEVEYDMEKSEFISNVQPVKLATKHKGKFMWVAYYYDNRATFIYTADNIRTSNSFDMNSGNAVTNSARQFLFDSGDPDLGYFTLKEIL